MEVIGEAPPPLPPKSSKVRQTLKKAALESENISTLPSNAVLKQKIIINQKPEFKGGIIINGLHDNKNHSKKNNAEKPVNGFRSNKSNHLIKSEVNKPQRRFEPEEVPAGSHPNRTVKINNGNESSPPPSKSLTVTSQSEENNNNNNNHHYNKSIAETYKTQFSNTRAKFVNGSESKSAGSENRPKIITWAEKKKENKNLKINERKPDNAVQEDEFLYQNVSNTGTNYIEYKLNGIISKKGGRKSEPMIASKNSNAAPRTSQIEVRQVKNKTVVKISINDANVQKETHFKPLKIEDEEYSLNDYQYPDVLFSQAKPTGTVNEYAEPFSNGEKVKEASPDAGNYQKPGQVYANIDKSKKKNRRNKMEEENNLIYENSEVTAAPEQFYANLDDNTDDPELVYANLNEEPECDQVYENQEFEVLKNSKVTQSVIEKNPVPGGADDQKNVDQDVYENHDMYEDDPNTYENTDIPTFVAKKNIILKKSPKPTARAQKFQYHFNDAFFNKKEPDPEPKNGKVIVTINTEDIIIKPIAKKSEEIAQTEEEDGHKRAESLTSSGVGVDSESENESNISCDSLNSNELNGLSTSEDHGYHTPENKSPIQTEYQNINPSAFSPYEKKTEEDDTYENTDIIQQVANVAQKIKNLRSENAGIFLAKRIESTDEETYENYRKPSPKAKKAPAPPSPSSVKTLPKGLLQDIRSRNVRLSSTYPNGEKPETVKETPVTKTIVTLSKQIKGQTPRQVKKAKSAGKSHVKVEEKTYEERKTEPKIEQKKIVTTNKICAMEIDTDKFYKFHLFENREEPNLDKNSNEDETFAGVKDYLNREKPAAITSAKGTIRGVKNRVKAGIATFLQMQENKNYKDKDAGKIVVYSTTMGIVRETYHKCLKVKQILKTLMVKFEERDVFMSTDAQDEIRERMKCDAILVPQVFVEGQHIGDAETIERLNESGELRKILKPYKSPDACSTCQVCGGYRLLPCRICKGSKKSIHRNSFTAEFVSLKCMSCDQVGLTRCHAC